MVNYIKPDLDTDVDDYSSEIVTARNEVMAMSYNSPTNLPTNTLSIDRTNGTVRSWNGSSWDILFYFNKPGDIIMCAYPSAPNGWLLCNGAEISRVTYAALFSAISTTYGAGNGTTTFNLPDMRGRFPLGVSISGTGSTLGQSGGSIDHSHTINHTHNFSHTHGVPAHYHSKGNIAISSSGAHVHDTGYQDSGTATPSNVGLMTSGNYVGEPLVKSSGNDVNTASANHTHSNSDFSGSVGNTGGSDGDSTLTTSSQNTSTTGASSTSDSGTSNPPYLALNFIIKI